jgi:hypothetical protein
VDIALKERKKAHRFAGRLLSHAVERVEQIQLIPRVAKQNARANHPSVLS